MEFDTTRFDERTLKFLASLYEMAREHVSKNACDPDDIFEIGELVIGDRVGLTEQEAVATADDLFARRMVGQHSGPGDRGRMTYLKPEGFRLARQYLEGKSPAAKRRRVMGKAGEFVDFAMKEAIKKLIPVMFLAAAGWWNWPTIRQWVRSHLGF